MLTCTVAAIHSTRSERELPQSMKLAPTAKPRDVMIELQVLQKDRMIGTKQNGWRQPCLVLLDDARAHGAHAHDAVRECVDLLGADLVERSLQKTVAAIHETRSDSKNQEMS